MCYFSHFRNTVHGSYLATSQAIIPNYCQIIDIEGFLSHKLYYSAVTFAHADGAALLVLTIAIDAVLVTGEGRTLYTATHLAAMLVSPEGNKTAMRICRMKRRPQVVELK